METNSNTPESEPPQPVAEKKSLVGVASTDLFCVFHGRNGYNSERERANAQLVVGKQYRVTDVEMHSTVTYITLEGERTSFNSVMFDVDHDALYRWAFPQNAGSVALELAAQDSESPTRDNG